MRADSEIIGIIKEHDGWWYLRADGIKESGASSVAPYIGICRNRVRANLLRHLCAGAWESSRVFWWRFMQMILNVYARKVWWPVKRWALKRREWIWNG